MEQNSDIENREIERIMDEDLRRTQERNEEVEPRTAPRGSRSLWKSIIFTGVGVLILIIVFIVFFKSHEKAVTVDLNTIRLKLNILEGRLTHLEKQGPELQESMSKVEEPESSLILRLDELSQQVDQLEKQMASAAMEAEAPLAVPTKPTAQAKGRYHEVRGGETLYRIARKYGITVDELCRLNEITPKQVIKPGQKLLVTREEPE